MKIKEMIDKKVVSMLIIMVVLIILILLLSVFTKSKAVLTYSPDNIENRTYIIGKHMFNRDVIEDGYGGVLTTKYIMLAAKTIESNSLDDMIIYYKNYAGQWVNAITNENIEVSALPRSFEIEYKNNLILSGNYPNPPEYTIIYRLTSSIDGETGTTASSEHTYGVPKTLTPNGFTKEGYTFLGWSTNPDAKVPTYTDGQSVKNLTSIDGQVVNLYAIWGQQVPFQYKLLADSPTITAVTSDTQFHRTDTKDLGLWAESRSGKTEGGTVYFYRGAVSNNWVLFAGKYWRIVRINEDGSVRMIYAGTVDNVGENTGFSNPPEGIPYNTSSYGNASVGYMFGDTDGLDYETTHMNTHDSEIKKHLDSWYVSDSGGNLTEYTNYLSKTAIYCNDRSLSSGEGVGSDETLYGAGARLSNPNYQGNETPQFKCPNTNDMFTTNSSTHNIGNKKLTYPIATITTDELVYAGGGNRIGNDKYYISQNGANAVPNYWWTMSPYGYNSSGGAKIVRVTAETSDIGALARLDLGYEASIRPVISLKSCVRWTSGNGKIGTGNSPYTVTLPTSCASLDN